MPGRFHKVSLVLTKGFLLSRNHEHLDLTTAIELVACSIIDMMVVYFIAVVAFTNQNVLLGVRCEFVLVN